MNVVHIDDVVAFLLAQRGKPYWNKDERRFGLAMFDCSGIHVASWRACGLWYPSWATWSGAQLRWGLEQETGISFEEARATFGAVMVRGGLDGAGDKGHIVTSLGDGRTMEAMGTAYGCRIGKADGRGFDDCFRVPGVLYRGEAVPAPPINWAAIAAVVAYLKEQPDVWAFLRDPTPGSGKLFVVLGGGKLYLNSPRAASEMQNIAETFGQRNVQFRDTDPNVLAMIPDLK